MPESIRAVFLSYAREDTDAARRIADALRSRGVEVWFDQSELRGGDAWDAKIRRQINDCTLFLPIISAHTQERGKGYFRLEWKLAVEQTHLMAEGIAFLAPVVVDETPESGALVPPEFMRVQWTRLPGALPTPQFVDHVKHLLEHPGKTPAAAKPAAVAYAAPAAPRKPGVPGWAWGVLGAVVVGVVVALVTRRPAEPTAPLPAPAPKPAAPAAPAAPAVSDKSIAVLPFSNMSEEKDSGFFADGIHEDILTNLALVRQLHVVSRTSVMQYRATTKSIRQIGEELGVAYVLEGSVRRAGNKVRVTGQLINAKTDEHVWAKAYDRDLTDIFGIQAELSQEIAGALSAALSPQEKSLLERRPTDNLAAYDAYVKARQLSAGSVNRKDLDESETLLQQAVKLDPNFAAAWAALGSLLTFQYFGGTDHTDERLARAKAAIDTAVRLAPDAPEVIENLGDYYYYGYRDYTRAVEQYERLAVLRPNDAVIYGSLALIHRRQGRFKESLAEFRRAMQLDPRSLRYARSLAETAQFLCLYDEALPMMRRAAELSGHEPTTEAQVPLIPFNATGSTKEGEEWLARMPPEPARTPTQNYLIKNWALQIGDFAGFAALDRRQRYADTFGEANGVQDTNAALVFAAMGDKDAARKRAGEAVDDLKAQLEKQPANEILWTNLGLAYAVLGERAESLRCAHKAMDLVPETKDAIFGPGYSINYASCLAWLGDKDRALAELARLLRTPRGENIYAAKAGVFWFPLRGDPRFEALVNDPKNNAPML